MSHLGFQAALSAMIRRPDLARQVRTGDTGPFMRFDLNEVETRRLVGVARQPGIAFYASLSRANRVEAIAEVFPQTLAAMQAGRRRFLDNLWSSRAPNHRLDREAEFFADSLAAAIRNLEVTNEKVIRVFVREHAAWRAALGDQAAAPPSGPLLGTLLR